MDRETKIYIIGGILIALLSIILSNINFLGLRSAAENINIYSKIMQENCSNYNGVLEGAGIGMRCAVYYIDEDGFKTKYYMNYDLNEGWYKTRD
jgi:hypothetical protein